MGMPVMILGESGTGKSASLRSFAPGEIGIINVAGKPLPFRSKLNAVKTDNYGEITTLMKRAKTPSIAIDDAQYLMANEFMRRAKEVGFQKFTDIATNYWGLVQTVINDTPDNRIVYFMSHLERDANGNESVKTVGKMLNEKITVEGMFTIVLKTHVQDGVYQFCTANSGMDTVKAPMGMFNAPLIDNDLKAVDDIIREYYGLEAKRPKEAENGTV